MRIALYVILSLVTAALLGYGIYLLVRIAGVYRRLRSLNVQQDYETLLYAALPGTGVDEVLGLIPAGAHDKLLAEVLERMGRDTEGEMKEKVDELYRHLGFQEKRPGKMKKARLAGED